jgi:hypothetical protein
MIDTTQRPATGVVINAVKRDDRSPYYTRDDTPRHTPAKAEVADVVVTTG